MHKTHFKRATALTLVVTLVLCQGFVTSMPLAQVVSKVQPYVSGAGNVVATRSAAKLPGAAHLTAHGAVTLNGHAVPTGATVFSGGGVKTAENSTAVLSFGAMGQVELASASDFTLAVEGTTLGGQLRAGSATIVAPAGVAVKIVTADGPVVTDGKEAVVLTVDVLGGKTRVETNNPLPNIKMPAGVTPTNGGGGPIGGGASGGFGALCGVLLAGGITGFTALMTTILNNSDNPALANPVSPIIP